MGRELLGHRQLAQHQHDAVQLPPSRDVRVGVGVLGRWRLQRQLRRRPDASVEVHGERNTDTHPYNDANANANAHTNSNSNGDTDTNRDATAYANAKGAADAVPTADASLIG